MTEKSPISARDELANELLTVEDLMVIFKVSKATIKRWTKKGILQAAPFGVTNYYSLKNLKKTIRERTHPLYNRKDQLKDQDSKLVREGIRSLR